MNEADCILRAKELVQQQNNEFGIGTPRGNTIVELDLDEIFVIWFSYIHGNWTAILRTSRTENRIWEIAHIVNYSDDDPEYLTSVKSYLMTHHQNIPE